MQPEAHGAWHLGGVGRVSTEVLILLMSLLTFLLPANISRRVTIESDLLFEGMSAQALLSLRLTRVVRIMAPLIIN